MNLYSVYQWTENIAIFMGEHVVFSSEGQSYDIRQTNIVKSAEMNDKNYA